MQHTFQVTNEGNAYTDTFTAVVGRDGTIRIRGYDEHGDECFTSRLFAAPQYMRHDEERVHRLVNSVLMVLLTAGDETSSGTTYTLICEAFGLE